jgi:bifunctional pyridoxal-dependent enzyme with beta-cystathionase and maltose regulon repressor activities
MSIDSQGREPQAFCSQARITRLVPWISPRLAEIAEACRRDRLWLISDEIYHGLEYEAPAEAALAHSDEAIVVNSFTSSASTSPGGAAVQADLDPC